MEAIIEKIVAAWKRTAEPYTFNIYALYAEEALTGWALILDEPVIGEFQNLPCVCVNLADWVIIRTLANATVTPFRVVAQGKGLIAKPFAPHTGLKYAVRSVDGTAMVHIPVEDFKSV